MCRKIIVIDDNLKEPLSQVALSMDDADKQIELMGISEFISDCGVRFVNGEVKWSDEKFSANRDPVQLRVLDRVVEVSDKSVMALDEKGLICRGQVYFAYEEILNRLAVPISEKRAYSTVGNILPLTSQWKMLASHITGVNFPKFMHGYGPQVVQYDELQSPIFKSPFDYYSWRPNTLAKDDEIADLFVVDAPKGSPVISYILGKRIFTVGLGNDVKEISPDLKSRLCALSREVATRLGALLGEVLWFVDRDAVTFAAFSPHLYGASHHEAFRHEAQEFITSYFDNYRENCGGRNQ